MFALLLLCAIVLTGRMGEATIVMPPPGYIKCDNSRDAVFQCAQQLLDLNSDGQITISEAETALSQLVGLPGPNVNATFLMRCDMDGNDILTLYDWNHPNSTCVPTEGSRAIVCDVCVRNGFVMSHETRNMHANYNYAEAVRQAKALPAMLKKREEMEAKRQRAIEEEEKRTGKRRHVPPPVQPHDSAAPGAKFSTLDNRQPVGRPAGPPPKKSG